MHEKQIEIRWRDMDDFGHVNNAVYLTYLEEARDEWLAQTLGDSSDIWGFVLARVTIAFRSELKQDDDRVVVRCGLSRIGNRSIGTREEILTLDGRLSAEARSVLVARDRLCGGSRPLTDAERAAFEREATTG